MSMQPVQHSSSESAAALEYAAPARLGGRLFIERGIQFSASLPLPVAHICLTFLSDTDLMQTTRVNRVWCEHVVSYAKRSAEARLSGFEYVLFPSPEDLLEKDDTFGGMWLQALNSYTQERHLPELNFQACDSLQKIQRMNRKIKNKIIDILVLMRQKKIEQFENSVYHIQCPTAFENILECADTQMHGKDAAKMRTILSRNGLMLQYCFIKNVGDLLKAAMRQNGLALEFADYNSHFSAHANANNYEIVIIAVKQNGLALKFAHYRLQDETATVHTALRQNGLALEFASDRLQDDVWTVRWAVRQNGLALEFASDYVKGHTTLVSEAVQQNGLALKFASPDLKHNKQIVLAAVQQNGLALKFASDKLKNDREVVLAAVRQNGLALEFASDELKNDREIVQTALQQNGAALECASQEMQADPYTTFDAVSQNLEALKFIAPSLKANVRFQLEAQQEYFRRHPEATMRYKSMN